MVSMRELLRFFYALILGAKINVAWSFRNLHEARDRELVREFRISKGRVRLKERRSSAPLNKLLLYSDYLSEIASLLNLEGRLEMDKAFIFNADMHLNKLCFRFLNPGNIQAFKEIYSEGIYNLALLPNIKYVAIDVGMNIGLSSLFFANLEQIDKVYGFELVPATYRLAKENIERNRWAISKCVPSNIAWAGENRSLLLGDSLGGSVSASIYNDVVEQGGEKVELRDASELAEEIINAHPPLTEFILKLDCEGAEYEVMRNLENSRILQRFCFVMIEWHFLGSDQLTSILKRSGFDSIAIGNPKYACQIGMIYAFKRNVRI